MAGMLDSWSLIHLAFVQYILHILEVAIMVSCRQCTTVLGVTH